MKNLSSFLSLKDIVEEPIRGEIFSLEKMEEYAVYLAEHLTVDGNLSKRPLLLNRMHDSGRKLVSYYQILVQAIRQKEEISPAAEWLVDNFHIVEDQLREIHDDLPKTYYRELPKITAEELAGYPRIYAIALALIAHTDSRLDVYTIRSFIDAFQTKSYLSIGELWAVAITLRLALVENIRRVSSRVIWDRQQRHEADVLAEGIIEAAQKGEAHFNKKLLKIKESCGKTVESQYAFVSQLVKRLRDQETEIWPATQCLEECLTNQNYSIEQIVGLEHQHQAADQVTIANIITSMRLLSSLNWQNFFESVSLVDKVLAKDPCGAYAKMNFETRNNYRHTIERISKRTNAKELEIAEKALFLAQANSAQETKDSRNNHVGYYLYSAGVIELERIYRYTPQIKEYFFRGILKFPTVFYLASLGILTIVFYLVPLYYGNLYELTGLYFILTLFLLFIPCSDLAVSFVNFILTNTLKPRPLAKLSLVNGIPAESKTLVVVPCLLFSKATIDNLLEKLEVHYLANTDKNLHFALLTDFVDAETETTDEDENLLSYARQGVFNLKQKYFDDDANRFSLFHRRRLWNSVEKKWMGWERKRGKIHELNRVLRGETKTSFSVITLDESIFSSFKYVITLDADTQLTRNSAKKLIGTISHPLNKAYFDPQQGRVTKGYGIIQPRISITLDSSSKSIFAEIFSGHTGIDPYTTAVSDVYQDIFGEGNYTGKGLYDIDSFEAALKDRVPDNKILSHDLFEGLYARTALVTDIELLDDYPTNYFSFFFRQHRWTRGDWQVAPWMFPLVRLANGKRIKNNLPLISKWKIYDNLRRSLVAPFLFLLFVTGWFVLPGRPLFWTGFGLLVLAFPTMAHVANTILISPRGISWTSNFWTAVGRLRVNLFQFGLSLIFLAHQAYIQTDAILRVFYRFFISKKDYLEWTTAAQQESSSRADKVMLMAFWPTEVVLFLLLISVTLEQNYQSMAAAFPLLFLWGCYPMAAILTKYPRKQRLKELTVEDRKLFQDIARRVWHFFETFVGPEDNWLPPDNFQEDPESKLARRTSPTNIGLYALSIISAKDFGYLSLRACVQHLVLLFTTIKKMETFEGHLYNWYDTQTLEPLYPKYISLVDSGNLAGYLLAVKQSCYDVQSECFLGKTYLEGIKTTLDIVETELRKLFSSRYSTSSITIQHLLIHINESKSLIGSSEPATLMEWNVALRFVRQALDDVRDSLTALEVEHGVRPYQALKRWLDELWQLVKDLQLDMEQFAPYACCSIFNKEYFFNMVSAENSSLWNELNSHLGKKVVISQIPSHIEKGLQLGAVLKERILEIENIKSNAPYVEQDFAELEKAMKDAQDNARAFMAATDDVASFCEIMFEKMNFKFLIDPDRQVFYIGYNVVDSRFDNAYYDLLASEARLASFIAIAKGDVEQRHWFQLGRQLVPAEGRRAMISWSASMFEYLMPHLLMKNFDNTLIDETLHTVIQRQINYGRKLNVPWGVSEAAYNARDLNFNYQYGPFGIPGLGLKRGLGHDLVISPYSTFLAALLNPGVAVQNIKALISQNLLTDFGFYEAVDYTPERLAEKNKYVVIRSFMAHHQGMTLVAVNNVLNNNIMQRRFHSELRVRATQLLLQERVPQKMALRVPKATQIEWSGIGDSLSKSFTRVYEKTHHLSPRVQLLSNGRYSLFVSTAGAGYSKCENLAVTRWREDAARDNCGNFIYVKDVSNDVAWATTYQPPVKVPDSYKAAFSEDKAEFWRQDGDFNTHTQIIVAPEDNVELRQVTVTNQSNSTVTVEVTSYAEPVLCPLADDLAHPSFSKLFLQTEFLEPKNCLIAHRRPRSEKGSEIWGFHCVVTDGKLVSPVQYESDRARFIGRGRDLYNPQILSTGQKLSNTVGSTLDPIFSIRVQITIAPGKSTNVVFSTGLAYSREEALRLADRYHDIFAFERESKLAWTKARIDLRHLGLDSEEAYLYQRLAERIIYSDPTLRLPSYQLIPNVREQASLWPYGISGDLPIVVVVARDKKDVNLVRKLLRSHEYLRLKGLAFDLVVLNDSRSSYLQELQDEMIRQVRFSGAQGWLNKPAGIFILRLDLIPKEDQNLIQAMAKVLISSEWGSLKEQINRKIVQEKNLPVLTPISNRASYKDKPLSIPKIDHFNGLGGFSKDGQEYVIVLQPEQWTPLPWINVIANKNEFGFQVSESGSGFTWSKNSRENRITPWSNDPVCDTPGEAIYLRDEETGEIWSPTPLPIRSQSVYLIRHGQGYSIFEHSSRELVHSLKQFVPVEDTVKISHLNLRNTSDRTRRISITAYVEWVLGNQREKSAPYILTETDPVSGAIIARNNYNHEFAKRISFLHISGSQKNYTCDRKEFIGRNGNYLKPSALYRQGLSARKGIGLDPCGALQTIVEIESQKEIDIIILLGQEDSLEQAQKLILKYKELSNCEKAFMEMQESWNKILNTIQVKTPESILNLMLNKWLLYQAIVCRFWARSAFYQSGGAYGFRDQLQDCMAFLYTMPETAREHILKAASRQFVEGDVQHWWHPPTGKGVRTRFSDDLLWLPFVVSQYILVTNDKSILTEQASFLTAPLLEPGQEDAYIIPEKSAETATLYEHCIRAIDKSLAVGQHGLPLIGCGDWNDGMNRIGEKGKGESVWLAWFLYKVLQDFLPFCKHDHAKTEIYEKHMKNLLYAVEKNGWDGNWYRRAFYDDGTPVGSSKNDECKIDSLAQTWSVISKAGDPARQREAMAKVAEHLILTDKNLILLLTPPFDKTPLNPGYIKGYVPGVRENGGQYVHAALWVVMAFAELGEGNRALELLNMLNPINLTKNRAGVHKYKIEPYVVAADTYAKEPHTGRGGWSWYTGSASWFYRVGLESILGLRKEGDRLQFKPCIPQSWHSFEISYQFKSSVYQITVENPHRISTGNVLIFDNISQDKNLNFIPLVDDGRVHSFTLRIEKHLDDQAASERPLPASL